MMYASCDKTMVTGLHGDDAVVEVFTLYQTVFGSHAPVDLKAPSIYSLAVS